MSSARDTQAEIDRQGGTAYPFRKDFTDGSTLWTYGMSQRFYAATQVAAAIAGAAFDAKALLAMDVCQRHIVTQVIVSQAFMVADELLARERADEPPAGSGSRPTTEDANRDGRG